jgi:hypothetical protein
LAVSCGVFEDEKSRPMLCLFLNPTCSLLEQLWVPRWLLLEILFIFDTPVMITGHEIFNVHKLEC